MLGFLPSENYNRILVLGNESLWLMKGELFESMIRLSCFGVFLLDWFLVRRPLITRNSGAIPGGVEDLTAQLLELFAWARVISHLSVFLLPLA